MGVSLNDKFAEWFKGDLDAIHFALQFWDALQLWDDVIDEGDCRDMQALLAWLAFDKEEHPFFAAHASTLRPVFLSVYLQWTAANELERSDVRLDVQKAWMLRAGLYGFFHVMARLCGGDAWAREVGPDIWRFYAETPEQIIEEFAQCRSL